MLPISANLHARLALWHRAWRYRLRVERQEIAFLLRHVKRGDIALDIGAHKGGFTYWLNRAVGSQGRVLAFEPIPHLAAYLRQTAQSQPLRQVTVVEAALSSTAGIKTFYIPTAGHLGRATLRHNREANRTIEVQSFTLDQFCRERAVGPIAFIKCDVEGHELDLFQGAARVLAEDRPILLFECASCFHRTGGVARVFAFLHDLGYQGHFFLHGRTLPISDFRIEYQQEHGCMNFGFLPGASPTRCRYNHVATSF